MSEANETRLVAAEIIRRLFEQKEVGQIQLLYMQAWLSIKALDPELFAKMKEDEK